MRNLPTILFHFNISHPLIGLTYIYSYTHIYLHKCKESEMENDILFVALFVYLFTIIYSIESCRFGHSWKKRENRKSNPRDKTTIGAGPDLTALDTCRSSNGRVISPHAGLTESINRRLDIFLFNFP